MGKKSLMMEKVLTNLIIKECNKDTFSLNFTYLGKSFKGSVVRVGTKYHVNLKGNSYTIDLTQKDTNKDNSLTTLDKAKLVAPITGIVKEVLVTEQQAVKADEILIRIEAMKMVLNIKATNNGIVKSIKVKEAQKVAINDLIMEMEYNEG